MTREEFINRVETPCNALTFDVGLGLSVVSRANAKHYAIYIDENNYGEYSSVEEMLDKFEVNGKKFADEFLPKIKSLDIVCA